MKKLRVIGRVLTSLLMLPFLLAACETPQSRGISPVATLPPDQSIDLEIVDGQLVFVPAYSEIFYDEGDQVIGLTITLAIHNTDMDHPIVISSVKYFDTNGTLIREFVDQPLLLNAMATTGFLVTESDVSGGWGSNFLVEWGAEQPVHEPVIEAIMISVRGMDSLSFVSPGRVLAGR